ncbi:MAG: peroxiredoxin [Candidatus Limnocylindrales bacterium]
MTEIPIPADVPMPGDAAPVVALPDAEGRVHDLAAERGHWVVLYFYPTDDTPGCTTEACEFRDTKAEFDERGAVVWGVSPQGARSKAKFRSKFELQFPLLSDVDHVVAEAYGSWVEKDNYGKKYMGTARRTFLIDPSGNVAKTWPKVKPAGHAAEVLAALDEARAGA